MSMGIRRLKHPIDHRLGPGNPVNHAVEEWPFLITLRGLSGGGCMLRSFPVAIAIVGMDGTAIPITDSCLASSFGHEIEGAAGACQHPPNMRACPSSLGDHRLHQIARLVAEMHLVPTSVADREPMRIDAAHLAVAVVGGFDQQRYHLARFQMLRGALTDAHRV